MNKSPNHNGHSLMETLAGTLDVMLGRKNGLARMDLTTEGFWLSFLGLAIAGLIDASAYSMNYSQHSFAIQPTKTWFVFGSLSIALIGYAASMLALFLLCRTPPEQANYPAAVITNNWASLIASTITFPLVILSSQAGAGGEVWGMVSVFLLGAMIFIGTNLLRLSLQIAAFRAFIYFVATTAISVICVQGLGQLAGFSSPA